ncbi:Gfo/Idh/MocA family protein [Sediminicola sp. 1XM1-17]|uniref:Gfo/Idh/MocA family protein n=1 Tax=Sediminicola sp. 1XM1-17 TaxID=3127702 RepID=UPI0030775F2A
MENKIRWGILGPGRIAHSFAKDLRLTKSSKLVAVASRNLDRASEFAKEYDAAYAYGSYEELFNASEVDIIYIATPHTYHAALAIAAMEHGKHVLCEKPMGINKAEVMKMVEAAHKNKVFLMEALWTRFNPSIRKIKEMVDAKKIGDISYLQADFAFYALDREEEGRLLNPALAGGSLLDIGIYPIFLAYLMLGKPHRILASSKFHHTGAEIQTSLIFEYDKAQAMLYSGLTSNSEMKAKITGTDGSIYIHPRWHETNGFTFERKGEKDNITEPTIGKGYSYEIEEVNTCLASGKLESNLWSHKNSLELMEIMDHIREQTGIAFPSEG